MSKKVSENYIERLHAEDVGVFSSVDIEFNERMNFIVGPNGCGKTSILRCIALAVTKSGFERIRFEDHFTAWIDCRYNMSKYRIGHGEGGIRGTKKYRTSSIDSWPLPPGSIGRIPLNIFGVEKQNMNIAPLFIGAYRNIEYKKVEGMKREPNSYENRAIHHANALMKIEGTAIPNVKQWMINRYYEIDKDWASVYKENWEWIISKLQVLAPKNCSLQFKEIRRDLEPMFTVQGIDCYLEEISAGFQSILSLVFAIVEWIEGINEEENAYIPNAVGTVVVDELDVHLHPEWQLTIRESLLELFPKLQFIVTTHSPHLIATAEPGELIILPELRRELIVKPTMKAYAGWNTDQILEEVMGVRSLENKRYAIVLEKAMKGVERKDPSLLREAMIELEEIAHPSDAIMQVLKIKLAGLELGER